MSLKLDQAERLRLLYRLIAPVGSKLSVDILQVRLHRVVRNMKRCTNGSDRLSRIEMPDYFNLSLGERWFHTLRRVDFLHTFGHLSRYFFVVKSWSSHRNLEEERI